MLRYTHYLDGYGRLVLCCGLHSTTFHNGRFLKLKLLKNISLYSPAAAVNESFDARSIAVASLVAIVIIINVITGIIALHNITYYIRKDCIIILKAKSFCTVERLEL